MLQGPYLLSYNVTVGFCHFPWLPCTRLLQLSGWLFLGSSPTPRALTCTPVWLGFLLGCTLEKWLLFPHLSQYLPLAGPRPPYGWAWFPHPVQPNLVAGLPVLFLGLLLIILYRPGLVTLFISLRSFLFRCSPSWVLELPLAIISLPCLTISDTGLFHALISGVQSFRSIAPIALCCPFLSLLASW